MKSSHELARELLDLPDLPVAVNFDGEFVAALDGPWVQKLGDKDLVLVGVQGEVFAETLPISE